MHFPLSFYSPLWRMENRLWFYFPCRSPEWTRVWWFLTAMGGHSARAVKYPGKVAVRRSSRGGEGPGRRRRPRRRGSAVPSASASPSMPTPSTSMPGPCFLSLSLWWMWFTGWRTQCEEEAAGLWEWLPSRTVYKKLLELCHFSAGRQVQLKYTAGHSEKTKHTSEEMKCYDLWIWKYGNYWKWLQVYKMLTGLIFKHRYGNILYKCRGLCCLLEFHLLQRIHVILLHEQRTRQPIILLEYLQYWPQATIVQTKIVSLTNPKPHSGVKCLLSAIAPPKLEDNKMSCTTIMHALLPRHHGPLASSLSFGPPPILFSISFFFLGRRLGCVISFCQFRLFPHH